jgi:hypothetical protein
MTNFFNILNIPISCDIIISMKNEYKIIKILLLDCRKGRPVANVVKLLTVVSFEFS